MSKESKKTEKKKISYGDEGGSLFIIWALLLLVIVIYFLFGKMNLFNSNIEKNRDLKNSISNTKLVGNEIKNFSSITEKEFKDNFEGKKEVVVIDIRTKQEFEYGKIYNNVLNIDFYKKDFIKNIKKLDKNKIYFIYCHIGNRTKQAMEFMRNLGFKRVYDLKGGIKNWKGELIILKKNNELTVDDYKGKVSFIANTSTSCSACKEEVPVYYKDIYKKYGDKINFYIYVINNKWEYDFNQGHNPNFDYKVLTGDNCGFIPSWVILDKDGNVIKKMCGGVSSVAIDTLEEIIKK